MKQRTRSVVVSAVVLAVCFLALGRVLPPLEAQSARQRAATPIGAATLLIRAAKPFIPAATPLIRAATPLIRAATPFILVILPRSGRICFCLFLQRAETHVLPVLTPQKVDGVYTLPSDKLKVAVEYTRKRTVLEFAETAWSIVQVLLILAVGAVARMRNVAERLSRWFAVQGFAFFLLFSAATAFLSLPLEMYGHHIAVAYGQSVQAWGSWFGDWAKGFVLSWLVGSLIVLLLFRVMKKSPKRWWFWFWFPAMAAVVFGVFVTPVLIDPLFNKFEPLAASNPALVEQLERVVERGGIVIPPERMFLMKASEKVTGLNAYVTGIGASKRVVVWDTSIAKATPDEISFIFGHEMGHYVLNHIYEGIGFAGVVMMAVFWVGFHCVQSLVRRYGMAWGVQGQQDWAVLAVIVMVMLTLAFLIEPTTSAFSRWEEHAADVYGQEAIHGIVADPQAVAAHSFQVLGEESLDDPTPRPLVEFWTFSHPSIQDRKAFAAAYNPWIASGRPGVGMYFKK